MTQPSFIERLEQRRQSSREGAAAPEPLGPPVSNGTMTRRATLTVPMTVAQGMAQLLAVLAGQHQLAAITLSPTPTKKELLAILENRTAEVLTAVNETG